MNSGFAIIVPQFTKEASLSKMSEIVAKISQLREKTRSALEDVPDNLIGFILFLVVLTVVGLGILIALGFFMTQ
jgi:hypothetical protein